MAGEAISRAPYASDPALSRGRLYPEPSGGTRSAFRRDCDRIIHSNAFRRLAYKTQVFVFHEGDHFRTRLTHTLEVTQIARSLARALSLDEDLAEGCALGHDLGHPPFGHAGERALDRCLADYGGFDHNAQTLRVVTALERRYPEFDGLNLSWETLEGLVKHNGPLTDRAGQPSGKHAARGVPQAILNYVQVHDLQLWTCPSAEAQAGAIADDIAYDAHDIDDGLRAGLFDIAELEPLPVIGRILRDISLQHQRLDPARRVHELMRRLITRMIEDVVAQSRARLAPLRDTRSVRQAAGAVVSFSPEMAEADAAIKAFLYPKMYRHERVMRIMWDAEAIVRDLFGHYRGHETDLPPGWLGGVDPANEPVRARRIADYIAGMTDRFAMTEHTRLFGRTPDLR